MSITVKVLAIKGINKDIEWTEVVSSDSFRIVTPNGTEYDLYYTHEQGLIINAKSDVLYVTPHAPNMIMIRS